MAPHRFHLHALGAAAAVAALAIAAVALDARTLVTRYDTALLEQSSALKDQGRLLQWEGFHRPDVLPLYGSSELVKSIDDKASVFFRRFPTEFAVSPVGKAGTTSLIVAEKVGAMGAAARGHKVAVSLSPSFFYAHALNAKAYAGNFSPQLGSELLASPVLSRELKRDLARRMADFPATLETRPLLRAAVQRLSGGSPVDGWISSHVLEPVLRVSNAFVRLQDLVETGFFAAEHERHLKTPPHREMELAWENLVELWEQRSPSFRTRAQDRVTKTDKHFQSDAEFIAALESSTEWDDLRLLLRTMRELGAEPLLLSIPLNGVYFDEVGVSAAGRRRYYEMLEAVAAEQGVALADFREHEDDAKFFADTHDHLSAKGWIFFDEAMDEFFHDRPLSFVAR